ncbi:hypothetical protein Dcar01_03544 [Deinococcus carri]|uniref:Uncharacterized protein n=1 Tax=Deinococcus carri TaxID=1211323 RepID=A0ABP9WBT6_9DEIO
MSKRQSKRHRRRQQQQGYALPDVRRDYLASLERRGRMQTTPIELRWQAVCEPFYLRELGLMPVLKFPPQEPRYQPPPVIRTRRFPDT